MKESNKNEFFYDKSTPYITDLQEIDTSSLTEQKDNCDITFFVLLGRVSAFGPSLDGGFDL